MIATPFRDRSEQLSYRAYEQIIDELASQNYSVCDALITTTEIELLRHELRLKYEADQFKKAAIGDKTTKFIEQRIRNDTIYWLDEDQAAPCEQDFFALMDNFIAYLNRTCFTGICSRNFHYAVYPEGHFYKRHLDIFQDDSRRKLSVICYLNETNWQPENGGELVLYPQVDGSESTVEVRPLPGRVLVFDSQEISHEVKPVKRGCRYSLTGWFKTR